MTILRLNLDLSISNNSEKGTWRNQKSRVSITQYNLSAKIITVTSLSWLMPLKHVAEYRKAISTSLSTRQGIRKPRFVIALYLT